MTLLIRNSQMFGTVKHHTRVIVAKATAPVNGSLHCFLYETCPVKNTTFECSSETSQTKKDCQHAVKENFLDIVSVSVATM
jgi:hypothetical protein